MFHTAPDMQTWQQARAHALLKAKEGELRTAREDAQAEHAAELAAAQRQLAEASKELSQVQYKASHVSVLPLFNLMVSVLCIVCQALISAVTAVSVTPK